MKILKLTDDQLNTLKRGLLLASSTEKGYLTEEEFYTVQELTKLVTNALGHENPDRIYLPKKVLKHGSYYYGQCRATNIARWCAEDNLFYHWNTKFGRTCSETVPHEDDRGQYDGFAPYEEINISEIPLLKDQVLSFPHSPT